MLTPEQLAFLSEVAELQELDSIWLRFDAPGGRGATKNSCHTFEERRDGFFWTVRRLLENGHIVLSRWSDDSWLEGTPEQQIAVIRDAFPANDEGMQDSYWFYPPGCPVGVLWDWPGRDPKPFTS